MINIKDNPTETSMLTTTPINKNIWTGSGDEPEKTSLNSYTENTPQVAARMANITVREIKNTFLNI